tara:strand:+ start:1998 stop:3122 length:1125 start_codon:yes stop_codon:yes gene_type:complete
LDSTHYEICIVGAGIVGLSTAYFLAKSGLKVVVLDKDSIGSHASGFAYGGLSPLGEAGDPETILPVFDLAQLGMKKHLEFSSDIPELSGIDYHFRFRPAIDLVFNDEELTEAKQQIKWRQQVENYKVEFIDRKSALEIVPNLNHELIGATYTEGVCDVEPYKLVLALTQSCEKLGVEILNKEITGIQIENHLATSVSTKHEKIYFEQLVLCMGPWSGNISNWLGVNVPIRPLKGQILRLKSESVQLNASVGYLHNYAVTKPDGLIWAGTTEEDIGFQDSPTPYGRNSVLESLTHMIHGLDEAELVYHTACLRPLSKDGKVILGPAPQTENVFLGTGAGRKGILLGPGIAKITADLVMNKQPEIDISAFSVTRFL